LETIRSQNLAFFIKSCKWNFNLLSSDSNLVPSYLITTVRSPFLFFLFQTYLHSQHVCFRSIPRSNLNFNILKIKWYFVTKVVLFLTEETLYNIEGGRTMAHYCTHLCRQRTILNSITADSRQGSLAKHLYVSMGD
jgi:hypothetical protein